MAGPEPKRRSRIHTHPAEPDPAPDQEDPVDSSRAYAPTHASTRVSTDAGGHAPEHVSAQVSADTPAQVAAPVSHVQSQLKKARDAGGAVAAIEMKRQQRIQLWCTELSAARELGASEVQLREQLDFIAGKAGLAAAELPLQVWRAAGLDPGQ